MSFSFITKVAKKNLGIVVVQDRIINGMQKKHRSTIVLGEVSLDLHHDLARLTWL